MNLKKIIWQLIDNSELEAENKAKKEMCKIFIEKLNKLLNISDINDIRKELELEIKDLMSSKNYYEKQKMYYLGKNTIHKNMLLEILGTDDDEE